VAEYHAGPAVVRQSPATGRCDLYANGSRLVDSRTIRTGEPIGFRKDDGQVFALAGSNQIPLRDGNYTWVIVEAHVPMPDALEPIGPTLFHASGWHTTGGFPRR
jgi:hypothetical protein